MRHIAAAILALTLALADSCSRPQTTTLRIGYVPIADNLQLYVGIKKGFYAAEGLQISTQALSSGPQVIEALSAATNRIDVGFSNVVSMLLARSRGIPIVGL